MGISETQFETWSHQGSISQSAATYNTIKNVLEASTTPYFSKNWNVFLQGSYGNDTNIYAESDVDVVICIDDVFYSDVSRLTKSEQSSYDAAYKSATYSLSDFKKDVLGVLSKQYGADVKAGDKAITISANGGRRKADVIVAAQFRRYLKFNGIYDEVFERGICFYNASGERIANYPKQHSENLTKRHQLSNCWLKPMVRVLKNLRSKLVAVDALKSGDAPSYYLEGLLYNVPVDKFGISYSDCFVKAINWIQREADKTQLLCANKQYYLLRNGYHTSWPIANANAFINAAITLWNNSGV